MILVTGATGLVGAHLLLRLCEEKKTVKALFRTEKRKELVAQLFKKAGRESLFKTIIWEKADITDTSTLEPVFNNIKTVYHCAALVSFDPNKQDEILKTNIEGTANLVNFCLAFNIEKLCFLSSIAAIGEPKAPNIITDETAEWNPEKPHSDYALSKYGAEMEVWRGQQEGLNTVIVNPGVIFGEGFKDEGSQQILALAKKKYIPFTNSTLPLVHVSEVIDILMLLNEKNISNDNFILVGNQPTFEAFFNALKDKSSQLIEIKPWLSSLFWKLDFLLNKLGLKKRIYSKQQHQTAFSKTTYSSAKIKNTLDFNFTKSEAYFKWLK